MVPQKKVIWRVAVVGYLFFLSFFIGSSGTIGLSDTRKASEIQADEDAKPWGQEVVSFQGRKDGGFSALSQSDSRLEMNEFKPELFSASYWVYDTPGIINPDQVPLLFLKYILNHIETRWMKFYNLLDTFPSLSQ